MDVRAECGGQAALQTSQACLQMGNNDPVTCRVMPCHCLARKSMLDGMRAGCCMQLTHRSILPLKPITHCILNELRKRSAGESHIQKVYENEEWCCAHGRSGMRKRGKAGARQSGSLQRRRPGTPGRSQSKLVLRASPRLRITWGWSRDSSPLIGHIDFHLHICHLVSFFL